LEALRAANIVISVTIVTYGGILGVFRPKIGPSRVTLGDDDR
jgi:hypothetical protein